MPLMIGEHVGGERGKLDGLQDLFSIGGAERAGLQLAPASAEVVVDLVLGRTPRVDVTPFRLDREAGEPSDPAFRS